MIQEERSEIPEEIKRFNWGALLLNLIWGIRHGVWISFLTIIPIIGWFGMPILLGYKGNVWAWKKNYYTSTDKFLKSQRKWAIAGVIFFIAIFCLPFYFLNYSSPVTLTLLILNQDNDVVAYLGDKIHKNTYIGGVRTSRTIGDGYIVMETSFEVKGSKSSAHSKVKLRKFEDKVIIDELIISSKGRIIISKHMTLVSEKDT